MKTNENLSSAPVQLSDENMRQVFGGHRVVSNLPTYFCPICADPYDEDEVRLTGEGWVAECTTCGSKEVRPAV